ncbi:MAG TPA: asparagine synthase (glutamine-hydrolyzing) [Pyrinomonadaceae bacterium]|nr:asparagine synthase (glutamine-hydrolyzing) [Pyrinomonadaceae bacterium]
MCGIAGIAGVIQPTQAAASVWRMMTTLARRGPDADGLESWSHAVLGHKRLAIFDLSDAGRQPMLSPDGSVGIVFNGAIYNFKTLRNDLESLGYRFQSEADTEVLLHGYREWGVDVLTSKIRGMFAFAIWDDNTRRLYLVRDRLGVKPLVFATRGKQFAFASTIRALRAAGFGESIDPQGVADFLEFGFVTESRTIHQGIARLPAASILEWSENQTSIREYWRPPMPSSAAISFGDAVEETERLFLNAVRKRLAADVPVATLLSGGVDSSLVCWALSELGADISAYTVGTPSDSSDESADARATANQLGVRHQIFNLSPEDEPDIDELISAYSEPFACASALGMLRVSRAVKDEAKVLITGDGGDDVFLGYPEHRHLWLAERLARSSPRVMGNFWLSTRESFPRFGHLRRFASLLDYASGGLGAVTNAHDGLPSYESGVLGERLTSYTVDQRQIQWSSDSARHVLEHYLDYDRNTRFVSEFLTKVDGATMHYGLEARSPFLDQDLWEFASSLPFSVRLRHGKSKAVLRELARRKIGERIATGSKRGFTIPVERWLTGRWRGRVEETFRNSLLEKEGWIRSAPALKWLGDAAQTGWAPKQLWYLYVLESWLKAERNAASENSKDAMAGVYETVDATSRSFDCRD